MKPFNRGVFRAYDIRGLVDVDFDEQWAEALGRACGSWFAGRGYQRAVVGRDMRHSSPGYANAVARGLAAMGLDVVHLGMVPTPVFYWACVRLNIPAGVQVTASHNPPEYNGFKLWGGRTTLSPDEIGQVADAMAEVVEAMDASGFGSENAGRPGLISDHDPIPGYLDELESLVRLERPVRIVVDGGNGAAGEVCAEALRRCGAEVIPLFLDPDGNFPNHHPDPVVEKNTVQLKAEVAETGAEAGFGLDGDGDRIGVIDETGRLMYGDELTALLARRVLADKPGALMLGDVKCSHRLFNDITAHGGEARMAPTGHSLMKAELLRTGALLAGEMSGHLYFGPPWIGTDDAIYAALRLAQIMSESDAPLSTLLTDWPDAASTPEIRRDCPEEIKFEAVATLAEEFGARAQAEGFSVSDVDGVRLTWPYGWGLVRASNTQPVLVMRFEADDQDKLAQVRQTMESALASAMERLSAKGAS